MKKYFWISILALFVLSGCKGLPQKTVVKIVNNVNKSICKSGALANELSPDALNYTSKTVIYKDTKVCVDLGLINDSNNCYEYDFNNREEKGISTCVITYTENIVKVQYN